MTQKDPEVQEALALAISRIGILYPDAVDYFLSLESIPPELRNRVKSSSGTGTGGEILGAYIWDAQFGSILIPQIRQLFIDVINEMINCKNLAEAVELATEKIVAAIQEN